VRVNILHVRKKFVRIQYPINRSIVFTHHALFLNKFYGIYKFLSDLSVNVAKTPQIELLCKLRNFIELDVKEKIENGKSVVNLFCVIPVGKIAKKQSEVFVNLALKLQCHIVKNMWDND